MSRHAPRLTRPTARTVALSSTSARLVGATTLFICLSAAPVAAHALEADGAESGASPSTDAVETSDAIAPTPQEAVSEAPAQAPADPVRETPADVPHEAPADPESHGDRPSQGDGEKSTERARADASAESTSEPPSRSRERESEHGPREPVMPEVEGPSHRAESATEDSPTTRPSGNRKESARPRPAASVDQPDARDDSQPQIERRTQAQGADAVTAPAAEPTPPPRPDESADTAGHTPDTVPTDTQPEAAPLPADSTPSAVSEPTTVEPAPAAAPTDASSTDGSPTVGSSATTPPTSEPATGYSAEPAGVSPSPADLASSTQSTSNGLAGPTHAPVTWEERDPQQVFEPLLGPDPATQTGARPTAVRSAVPEPTGPRTPAGAGIDATAAFAAAGAPGPQVELTDRTIPQPAVRALVEQPGTTMGAIAVPGDRQAAPARPTNAMPRMLTAVTRVLEDKTPLVARAGDSDTDTDGHPWASRTARDLRAALTPRGRVLDPDWDDAWDGHWEDHWEDSAGDDREDADAPRAKNTRAVEAASTRRPSSTARGLTRPLSKGLDLPRTTWHAWTGDKARTRPVPQDDSDGRSPGTATDARPSKRSSAEESTEPTRMKAPEADRASSPTARTASASPSARPAESAGPTANSNGALPAPARSSAGPATAAPSAGRVAGPALPASGTAPTPLPTPTGHAARTRPAYPEPPPPGARTPRWSSGATIGAPTTDSIRAAAALARARGRAFDIVSARLPIGSWRDLTSPDYSLRALRQVPGPKVLSVSLLPDHTGSLRACAKGDYHTYWQQFADRLRAHGMAETLLDLRPDRSGAATADPSEHASCYRQVVSSLRERIPGVRTQWSVERGVRPGADPLGSWPGAAYVDVVGVDSPDTGNDWSRTVNGPYGLTWWADFAARQRLHIALASWGPFPGSDKSAANAAYVQNMHDWLVRSARRKLVAYEAFTAPPDPVGAAIAAYRRLF